jgi:ankyrin repeat protein
MGMSLSVKIDGDVRVQEKESSRSVGESELERDTLPQTSDEEDDDSASTVVAYPTMYDVAYYLAAEGYSPESAKLAMTCRFFAFDSELFRARVNHRFGINQETLLIMSCKHSSSTSLSLCSRLLDTGITNVNARTAVCQNTALHFAIQNQRSDLAEMLLSQSSINPNLFNSSEPPLVLALRRGDHKTTTALLSTPSIDVNLADSRGRSPLFWACGSGRSSAVRLLLSHSSIKVNAMTSRTETALSWACSSGHVSCVKLLLQRGDLDVNAHIGEHGFTALMVAVANSQRDVTELLLSRADIDVNSTPSNPNFAGWTALTFSSSEDMSSLLTAAGAV